MAGPSLPSKSHGHRWSQRCVGFAEFWISIQRARDKANLDIFWLRYVLRMSGLFFPILYFPFSAYSQTL
jgi:hypothetical protein